MKKAISVLLVMLMVLSMTACGGGTNPSGTIADPGATTESTAPEGGSTATAEPSGEATDATEPEIHVHTHSYGDYTQVQEATCIQGQLSLHTCSGCGQTEWVCTAQPAGHSYANGVCTACGSAECVGLGFTLNEDGKSYTFTDVGTFEGETLEIPAVYEGLPVTAIGTKAFQNQVSVIDTVIVPGSVVTIMEGGFMACKVKNIVLSYGVTEVGGGGFRSNKYLESIVLPESLKTMGSTVFGACTKLATIEFPASLETVGETLFFDCQSLTSIEVKAGNTALHSHEGVLYDTATKTLLFCPLKKEGSYTVEPGTEHIATYAFNRQSKLTEILLPDSLLSIGEYAFFDCSNVSSLTIPDSVVTVERAAFQRMSSLTEIHLGKGMTEIPRGAFIFCSELTTLEIPENITRIGEDVFTDSGLTSLTIPDSVTEIGDGAFSSCPITEIVVPASVTSLGIEAFSYCRSLTKATLECPITVLGKAAFCGCESLTELTLPGTITEFGMQLIYACTQLKDVHFGGTAAQWETIVKGDWWNGDCPAFTVHCTDQNITVTAEE